MPANIECPCGHNVRLPDEFTNTRIKCPVCGELLSTATAQPDDVPRKERYQPSVEPSQATDDSSAASPEPTGTRTGNNKQRAATESSQPRTVSDLHAKGCVLLAGLPTPSFFTRCSVMLLPDRVRIESSGLLGARRLDFRVSEITSAEIRRCPGWYLLVPGFLLLPANGVGLVFLLAFLVVRHSFLILHCGSATVAIRFKADDTDATTLGDAILQAACNSQSRGSSSE
jgi:hypothetical protein